MKDSFFLKITFSLTYRALIAWSGLFLIAFVNGALRELVIKNVLQDPYAHQLSAVTAIIFISSYTLIIWEKLKATSLSDSIKVGVMWFFLTILVETFILNRMVTKLTWNEIAQSYNIFKGEMWPLVLAWTGLLPVLMWRMRYGKKHR